MSLVLVIVCHENENTCKFLFSLYFGSTCHEEYEKDG